MVLQAEREQSSGEVLASHQLIKSRAHPDFAVKCLVGLGVEELPPSPSSSAEQRRPWRGVAFPTPGVMGVPLLQVVRVNWETACACHVNKFSKNSSKNDAAYQILLLL